MILIGSRALKLRAGGLLDRTPVDFDFVASADRAWDWLNDNERTGLGQYGKIISEGEPPVEFDLVTKGSSNDWLDNNVGYDMVTPFGRVPSLDILFTIKSSHKYRKDSPHFWKTLRDYHRMRAAGAKIIPELHKMREAESYAGQKHPKLNVMKKDFFAGDGVEYKYDHDDIHRAVKYLDRPAYTYYMRDGSQVMSDRTKFFDLPYETRIFGVLEECATLAIERSLVPFPGAMPPKQALLFAYSKVCSSITSGWFREFAYNEAPTVLRLMDESYWTKFAAALQCGQIKRL
jgi:hypothetical protein